MQDKDGKKVLVADKDFEKGDVVYKVSAVIASCLFPPYHFAGISNHCCSRLGFA